jgi:hypothetical protein
MAKVTMLTTYDNKVDPFEDYEGWRAQDEDVLHHYTCGYLARMVDVSPELSDSDYELAIFVAMQKIVEFEPETYKLVTKDVEDE